MSKQSFEIRVNGNEVMPNLFAVQMENSVQFKRVMAASNEFLARSGFLSYSDLWNMTTTWSLLHEHYEDTEPYRGYTSDSGVYYYDLNMQAICFMSGWGTASLYLDFNNGFACVNLNWDEMRSSNNYFMREPGTAIGRFMGQGLTFLPHDDSYAGLAENLCQIVISPDSRRYSSACGTLPCLEHLSFDLKAVDACMYSDNWVEGFKSL